MSIFDTIKHGLEKAGHDIVDGAEKAGRSLETAGERIAKEAKHDFEKVEHIAMGIFDDIKGELEKIGNGIKSDFEKLGDDIKKGVEQAYNEATAAVEQIPKDVASEAVKARAALEDVLHDLRADLTKAGDEIKSGLEVFYTGLKQGLEEAITDLEEGLSEAVLREAIEKAHKLVSWLADKLGALQKSNPSLTDLLDGVSDQIELGPVTLTYDSFFTRVEELAATLSDALAGEIEVTRTFIIKLITDLGPSSVAINMDVEVFATFGDKIPELPFAVFTEIADEILKEIGVPDSDVA